MVAEVGDEYVTEFAAVTAVAGKLGIGSAETLRKWVRQAEVDAGVRPGVSSAEPEEIRQLKRKVNQPKRSPRSPEAHRGQ
ncbi:MAG TPA: transposase [Pseudonocardiaceae bacterium]|nr:transposase [Pseudonocardiaceae bacterium]